jgi:two-component system, NtrC family, sensor kinase
MMRRVRFGLRLQILLFIGGLLVIALGPLLWAQSELARVSMERQQQRLALELGRLAARAELTGASLNWYRVPRLLAGYAVTPLGQESSQFGSEVWLQRMRQLDTVGAAGMLIEIKGRRALVAASADARGQARVALALDSTGVGLKELARSYALYMGLVALMLLVAIYIALGRLVVRPLETLAHAAERVAAGSRRWEVPQMPAREFVTLDSSLATMTARLLDEEGELRRRIDDVNAATERLKEAQQRLVRSERLASVGRLAAGLAHEIGNPLASLMGLEDLLIAGGLTHEEQADFLPRMRRETERIHRVLRDLLDFARPTQTKDRDQPKEPGDVTGAIDDALALLGPQKIMKQVEVIRALDAPLPLVNLARPELVQVLLNLLLNAADAFQGEGTIHVRATAKDRRVRIEVEDNGPGLPEQIRERLFEPFVTTKEIGKGTGLGLAVCRGLVEGAGGLIGWDASFVDGTRFVVELAAFEDKGNQPLKE